MLLNSSEIGQPSVMIGECSACLASRMESQFLSFQSDSAIFYCAPWTVLYMKKDHDVVQNCQIDVEEDNYQEKHKITIVA